MSHPLASLRRAYDVELPHTSAGDPPTAGDPVETELLRGMRRVLDARPAPSPSEAAVQSVLDQAASASSTALPLYAAYESTTPLTGEAEWLRQSRTVLDRAIMSKPRSRPTSDVEVLVLARAAEASGVSRDVAPDATELAPVAAAYGLATSDGVEAALLGSTRDALDRLPTRQPDASMVEGILAEASFVASTRDALDRLPTRQPDAATLDAILAQAALASNGGAAASARPAPDRAAAPATERRRRVGGIWVGSAALFAVALFAIVMYPFGDSGPQIESDAASALATQVDVASEPEERSGPAEDPAPEASAPLAAIQAPQVVRRSAPRGPSASEFTPVRAERAAASPAPPSSIPTDAEMIPTEVSLADAAPATTGAVPEWDVSDDVRLLSLRLQELRRQNQGLSWDQPAEAFGAPASTTTQPGVQAVREGAAPVRAQVRVRSDSARSNQ